MSDNKLVPVLPLQELPHVIGLVIVGFTARLLAIRMTLCVSTDAALYIHHAKLLARLIWDPVLAHDQHPLFSACIAVAHLFVSNWIMAAQLFSAIVGALTVVPLYGLVREGFGRRIALLTGLLFAVHMVFCEICGDVITEPLYLFCFLSALWAAWVGISRELVLPFFLWGLFAGLCYLTRPEGALAFILPSAVLVLRPWRRFSLHVSLLVPWMLASLGLVGASVGALYLDWPAPIRWDWMIWGPMAAFLLTGLVYAASMVGRRAVAKTLCWLLAFGVCAAIAFPYVLDVSLRTRCWRLTKKKKISEIIRFREVNPVDKGDGFSTRPGSETLLDKIRIREAYRKATGLAKQHGANLRTLFSELIQAARAACFPFLVIGFLTSLGQLRFMQVRQYMALIVGVYLLMDYGLLVSSGYLASRHTFVATVLLLPYAALGCLLAAQVLHQFVLQRWPLFRRLSVQALFLFCFAGMVIGTSERLLRPRRSSRYALRCIGEWIRDHGPPSPTIIMNNRPRIVLYANGKRADLFRAFLDEHSGYVKNLKQENVSYDGILRFARFVGADYLVVEKSEILQLIPDFFNQVDQRVTLVYEYVSNEKRAEHFFVYRIHRRGQPTSPSGSKSERNEQTPKT